MVKETAKILEIHENTIRELQKKGVLRAERDCRGWRRFDLVDVLRVKKERDELRSFREEEN